MSEAAEVLRAEHVAKRYGAVVALRDVTMYLKQGEVLGLVGDNGAGKSTLIKILTGYLRPDSGTIYVKGEEVQLRSVDHARSLGIDTVFFSFSTADEDFHAPNEFFRVHRLHEGLEAWARYWQILGAR